MCESCDRLIQAAESDLQMVSRTEAAILKCQLVGEPIPDQVQLGIVNVCTRSSLAAMLGQISVGEEHKAYYALKRLEETCERVMSLLK